MSTWPWRQVEGTGIAREAAIILQTLDTVVPDGEGAYLAAPISTGRRYYEALAATGTSNYAELIAAIGLNRYLETVRWPNVADGERIAADLRKRGVPFVINTGPLMFSGWHGSDYMELCYALIAKKVRQVYFHPEWAFSHGAVKQFLFCTGRNLPCRHIDGTPLTINQAQAALADACRQLRNLSLGVHGFETRLRELEAVAGAAVSGTERPML